MSTPESQSQPSVEETLQVMELLKDAFAAQSLEEFGARVPSKFADALRVPTSLLFISSPHMAAPRLFQHGFPPGDIPGIERLCLTEVERLVQQPAALSPPEQLPAPGSTTASMVLYPLRATQGQIGLIGFSVDGESMQVWPSQVLTSLLDLVARSISDLLDRVESARRLKHLNTYLTVSSMLAQSLDLHELLEMTLYCCMEVASAEAASVMLLDDHKKNLTFYQVEGPAKPELMAAAFPSDRGLAGSILQSQQSEVINDAQSDPRFYRQVDTGSGFQTRNLIAVPLVAGEEQVGVLEVLNKVDNGSFTEEERLLLVSIAEEIAFAIRNARMFEYVVNTYCKQRQGLTSCRGCQRPLGSWTPCVKYREVSL